MNDTGCPRRPPPPAARTRRSIDQALPAAGARTSPDTRRRPLQLTTLLNSPRCRAGRAACAAVPLRSAPSPFVPTIRARTIRGRHPRLVTRTPQEAAGGAASQPPRHLAPGVAQLGAVAGRDAVVGVAHAHQVGLGPGVHERVLGVLGPPARGGEEERDDRLAPVGEHLPRGGPDRRGGLRLLARHARVDLRPGVGQVVVDLRPRRRGHGVGASRHRLALQRLGMPAGGHLARHHSLHVVVEGQRVDHRQAAPGTVELQRRRGSCRRPRRCRPCPAAAPACPRARPAAAP